MTYQLAYHLTSVHGCRLFADDCLLYRTINAQHDTVILQEDLNILQQREARWLMSFNPDKCEVLRVTNKRKHILHTQYKIHDRILNTVDKTKYLGVTIQSKLNWKPHINNITKKANNIREFLQRNLSRHPRPVKEQAYETYVRPILEYASTVWDPHTIELTNQLEMVQRRAARFVTADYRRRHSVTVTSFNGKPPFSVAPTVHNTPHVECVLQLIRRSKVTMLSCSHPSSSTYIIYSNTTTRGHHLQRQQHHCRINTCIPALLLPYIASSTCGTNNSIAIRHGGGCFAHSIQEPTCLLRAALNHIMDHVLSAPHHAPAVFTSFTNEYVAAVKVKAKVMAKARRGTTTSN